jgi:hypothetical protein
MQFDPSKGTPLSPSASTSLKRSLAQQATASARKAPRIEGTEALASSTSSSKRATGRDSSSVFSPEFQMPTPSSSTSSQLTSSSWSRGGSFGQRATRAPPPVFKVAKGKGRGKGSTVPKATVFEGPLHDRNYVVMQFDQEYSGVPPLKPVHAQNPKSTLSNWLQNENGTLPQYEFVEGFMDGRKIWRYPLCCLHRDLLTDLCADVP